VDRIKEKPNPPTYTEKPPTIGPNEPSKPSGPTEPIVSSKIKNAGSPDESTKPSSSHQHIPTGKLIFAILTTTAIYNYVNGKTTF